MSTLLVFNWSAGPSRQLAQCLADRRRPGDDMTGLRYERRFVLVEGDEPFEVTYIRQRLKHNVDL